MRSSKFSTLILSAVISGVATTLILSASTASSNAQSLRSISVPPSRGTLDNVEIFRLFGEDQADRSALRKDGAKKLEVSKRDLVRVQSAVALVQKDQLKTGTDFYRAASVIQRSKNSEQLLLAHELAVNALVLGRTEAGTVAAVTEDRYLVSIGKKPRYNFDKPAQIASKCGVTSTMRNAVAPQNPARLEAVFARRAQIKRMFGTLRRDRTPIND